MAVSSDVEFWTLPSSPIFSPPEQWRQKLLQSIKRALFWAVVGSLLLHVYLLTQLPDLSAPEMVPEAEISYEISIIPTPEPKVEEPTPEPTPNVPAEAEIEPQTQPPDEPVVSEIAPSNPAPSPPAAAEPAVEPLDVITTEPSQDSPSTWTWRDQLLRQGNHLAPQTQSEQGSNAGDQDGQLPGNWVDPLMPDQSSWFEQYAPPGALEQKAWTETDGTIRLETTLPNGQRMCGRAQPPDPLQPLSFSIPVWTTCGKVRGKAAKRNPLRRPPPQKRAPPP